MKAKRRKLILLLLWVAGCAGGAVPKPYPPLATPRKTYDFAQLCVLRDDPDAFYHCLSQNTRERFPLNDFRLGWALAGQYFHLFSSAELQNVEQPAPEYAHPNTAKLTVFSPPLKIKAAFLLLREDGQWRLEFPSRYETPPLDKLPKMRRHPWRTYAQTYYREVPGEWYRRFEVPVSEAAPEKAKDRRPKWRD